MYILLEDGRLIASPTNPAKAYGKNGNINIYTDIVVYQKLFPEVFCFFFFFSFFLSFFIYFLFVVNFVIRPPFFLFYKH